MKLTSEQVRKVSKLANLALLGEEEKYSEQLSKILDYIQQLSKVDVDGVESAFNISDQNTIQREDKTVPSLSKEEALSNASNQKDSMFVTKGVFNE